jgi:nucleolin
MSSSSSDSDSDSSASSPAAKAIPTSAPAPLPDTATTTTPATEAADQASDEEAADQTSTKKPRKRRKKKKAGDESSDAAASGSGSGALLTPSTVFVEGLPYAMKEAELSDFLASEGIPPVSMRLPVWQDSGNLRGFGHVVFASAADAAKAIESVTGKALPKYQRYLTFKEANQPKEVAVAPTREQPKGCKSVFIKNLPYDATEESVKTAFQVCGKILDGGVRLPLVNPGASASDAGFGKIKGFGYVTFKEPESALNAVNKAAKPFGLTMNDRPLFVDFDEKGEKGIKNSFRTQDGRNYNKVYGTQSERGGFKRKAGGPRL